MDRRAHPAAERGNNLADRKSYFRIGPVGHIQEMYLGQMSVCSGALQKTHGETSTQALIHLPLM